jgi:DNA-binding transcriptional regulator YiaG
MKPELFAELLGAANEALEHAQGKRSLRSTALPPLPKPMTAREVRGTRSALQASQGVLARYLNVSTKLVQAWEAGERVPSGPALVLLRIIEQQPGLVDMFHAHAANTNGHRATANSSPNKKARR